MVDGAREAVEALLALSRRIGADASLVQPGGGNTSVKLEEEDAWGERVPTLVIKGSGTDLATLKARGLAHLDLARARRIRDRTEMTDEGMLAFLRRCMHAPERDPVPSIETPLHALLEARFVVHTHDVPTMTLTDNDRSEEHARAAWGDSVLWVPYVHPGFTLAKALADRLSGVARVRGLCLARHGLVAWGEDAEGAYAALRGLLDRAQGYIEARRRGRRLFASPVWPSAARGAEARGSEARAPSNAAMRVLPALRGALGTGRRVVLHLDDSPEVLSALESPRLEAAYGTGMTTPEHILRAGVRPLWIPRDAAADPARLRACVEEARTAYEAYHARIETEGRPPLPDWAKTALVPGVGLVTAGATVPQARAASVCYRTVLSVLDGVEGLGKFEFLADADAHRMEYWPLERRKIEASWGSERAFARSVVLVAGGASGIGRAAVLRFLEEGANVLAADRDGASLARLAREVPAPHADRLRTQEADVTDAASVGALFPRLVREWGGLDILFYSAGVAPELSEAASLPDEELARQMAVNLGGAVACTRGAVALLRDQGTGGRLVYNASKAALAPGRGAAAYGASKAALVHYVRNLAAELGREGITANSLAADAVDTPLFSSFVARRAAREGVTPEAVLARYRERSVAGEAPIDARYAAEAVLFLSSEGARYVTGAVLNVGGGTEAFPR
ncbi:MAG: SDR family oxidoreductase [Planctomycetes bacterium]|nr:SDR family oxidoreductase [Planctomycetota bacterium]